MSDDLSYERILSSDEWINLHTYTDKTTWDGVHKLILICFKRGDDRLDFSPLDGTSPLVLGDETWSDGYLVTNLEHTLEDSTASDTTLEVLGLFSWLVNVERSNDDHLWW